MSVIASYIVGGVFFSVYGNAMDTILVSLLLDIGSSDAGKAVYAPDKIKGEIGDESKFVSSTKDQEERAKGKRPDPLTHRKKKYSPSEPATPDQQQNHTNTNNRDGQ
jgi:hypothetical protein